MQFRQIFLFLIISSISLLSVPVMSQESGKTVSEYAARQEALQLAQEAENSLRELEQKLREAEIKKAYFQAEWKKRKVLSDEEANTLKIDLQRANEEESALKTRVKGAKMWATTSRKMVNMSKKKRNKSLKKYGIIKEDKLAQGTDSEDVKNKKLSKIEREERKLAAKRAQERELKTATDEPTITNPKWTTTEKEPSSSADKSRTGTSLLTDMPTKARPVVKFAKYNPQDDTFLYPPKPDCQVAFSGVDDFSGKERKDLKPQVLFHFTDERLRPYLKNTDYLTCQSYLSSLEGGYHFLTLILQIDSKNAQLEYGSIERGSVISIKTLDGKTAQMQANKTDNGLFDPRSEQFIYRVQYIISGSAKKILEEELIDEIRLTWSRGFEDYKIYEVDVLKRQFACLKN